MVYGPNLHSALQFAFHLHQASMQGAGLTSRSKLGFGVSLKDERSLDQLTNPVINER